MRIPDWLRPGLAGGAAGAVLFVVAAFAAAGWANAVGADRLHKAMTDEQVVVAFVPACAEISGGEPAHVAPQAKIQQAAVSARSRDVRLSAEERAAFDAEAADAFAAACVAPFDRRGGTVSRPLNNAGR